MATYISHGRGESCSIHGCSEQASGIQIEWTLAADSAGDEVHHGPLCDTHRKAAFGIYNPATGQGGGMWFVPFSGHGSSPPA